MASHLLLLLLLSHMPCDMLLQNTTPNMLLSLPLLLLLLRSGLGGPLWAAGPVRHEADEAVCQPVQCRPAAHSTGCSAARGALLSGTLAAQHLVSHSAAQMTHSSCAVLLECLAQHFSQVSMLLS
jgi:hypothetical protein